MTTMGSNDAPTWEPPMESIPASFRTGNYALKEPSKDIKSLVECDLAGVSPAIDTRLLWMVGRPYPPRPLNIQRVLKRDIIPTTDTALHLVWTSERIFIRVLPEYMLEKGFFDHFLDVTEPQQPYDAALGLLYTYVALVPTKLDFVLALEYHLFPEDYKWQTWKDLTHNILKSYQNTNIQKRVPGRYLYGELRLSRLDKIHAIYYKQWLHGYSPLTATQRYVDYFTQNLSFIATIFAWAVIILTSMQVALMTERFQNDDRFNVMCSTFSIVAIAAPLAAVAIILCFLIFLFLGNTFRSVSVSRDRVNRDGKVKNVG